MKKYVLTVSTTFPKTHRKASAETGFPESIQNGTKLHTIRGNYDLWAKRFEQINKGEALLSVRIWSGVPYRSEQRELFSFSKCDGIGLQKLENPNNMEFASVEGRQVDWRLIAENDGLTFEDFCEWFKVRTAEPMAVIHFTNFRY